MHATRILFRAAGPRTPMIKFMGKRAPPGNLPPSESPTSEPHPHPESPTASLPESFISYRSKAIQHGPLGQRSSPTPRSPPSLPVSQHAHGAVGDHPGHELGSIQPNKGQVWDRSELPARFQGPFWTAQELEAIELGGASVPPGWGAS